MTDEQMKMWEEARKETWQYHCEKLHDAAVELGRAAKEGMIEVAKGARVFGKQMKAVEEIYIKSGMRKQTRELKKLIDKRVRESCGWKFWEYKKCRKRWTESAMYIATHHKDPMVMLSIGIKK